jgi:hypothetical protein
VLISTRSFFASLISNCSMGIQYFQVSQVGIE